jgi:hypothetical protein
MTRLTKAQIERLQLLQEEASEIIQAASKILRFGYEGKHPSSGPSDLNNVDKLSEELGNLVVVLDLMVSGGELSEEKVQGFATEKLNRIGKYTNHQKALIEKVKERNVY